MQLVWAERSQPITAGFVLSVLFHLGLAVLMIVILPLFVVPVDITPPGIEATIVSEIGRVARSLVSFDETFGSVMTIVSRVVDFDLAAMAFVDGDDLDVRASGKRKHEVAGAESWVDAAVHERALQL